MRAASAVGAPAGRRRRRAQRPARAAAPAPCGTCGSSSTTDRRTGTVALRGLSPRRGAAARRSRCWAATARARARCCASPPGCSRPIGGPCAPTERSRCCCRLRPTTCCTSASWTSCPRTSRRRRCASWGWTALERARPARPVRRRAPAPCARHRAGRTRDRRRETRRRSSRSTSRRAAWTRRASASSPSASGAWRRRAPRCSSPPTTSSSRRAPRAAACCSASGRVVADGATREILSGGRYFTTEVARVLGPEARRRAGGGGRVAARAEGAAPQARHRGAGMSWQAGSALIVSLAARGGHPLVREPPPDREAGRAGGRAGRARGRRARAVRGGAERAGHHRRRAAVGLRPRSRARLHGRRPRRACVEPLPRPGAVDSLADGGVGRGRPRRRAARVARGPAAGPLAAGRRLRAWRALPSAPGWTCSRSRASRRRPRRDGYIAIADAVAAVQRRARDRQLRPVRSSSAPRSCGCWSASAGGCTCGGTPLRRRGARAPRDDHDAACADDRARGARSDRDRGAAARCATACGTWSGRRTPTADSAARRARHRASSITGWAVLGLEAAGRHPLDVRSGARTPIDFIRAGARLAGGDRGAGTHDPRGARRRARPAALRRTGPARRPGAQAPAGRLVLGSVELDRVRDHVAARERPVHRLRGRAPRRLPGWPASKTTTAASRTRPAAAAASWTRPEPRCRAWPRRARRRGRVVDARRAYLRAPRTRTAASVSPRARARTRSRPRGPSRASSRPAARRPHSGAAGRRRWHT